MARATRAAIAVGALLQTAAGLVQPRRLGTCSFANEPQINYYWDESCPEDGQSLGCMADGINHACRFCGAGDYASIPCPVSQCSFDNPPHLPYYWDADCYVGGIGCNADGNIPQCRFCGEFPYNGTVPCPALGVVTPVDACKFDNEPATPYFWDASCADGMLGCKADGKNLGCRFCGGGDYTTIRCPKSLCTFGKAGLQAPSAPYGYYWDPQCWHAADQSLGCLADGIHEQCRMCGAGDFTKIQCP